MNAFCSEMPSYAILFGYCLGTLQGLRSDNPKRFCARFSDTWFERCSSPQGFRLVLFIFTLFQYNILDSALKETSYLDLMQLSFFFFKKNFSRHFSFVFAF